VIKAPAALLLASVVLTLAPRPAQDVDGFVARGFKGANGVTLPYRLFVPERKTGGSLPAIVYLHGAAGAGTDNLKQITGGNTLGTHVWTTKEMQARYPAFVIAPQAPVGERWSTTTLQLAPSASLALELLTSLSKEFSIDADRIYLIGQSLGGFGTWDLVTKRPELFAAAVPLCGGGDPARVPAARNVPIWVFHGEADQTVPVVRSREMVAALRAAGSAVKYTEYPTVGHNVWTVAFAERELPDWLFAQRRKRDRSPF
jgi:predicted peptidase